MLIVFYFQFFVFTTLVTSRFFSANPYQLYSADNENVDHKACTALISSMERDRPATPHESP
jgi:hypothetical protein